MAMNKKYWAAYRDHAVALVPKCGNTSFSALVGGGRLSLEDALNIEQRIMFIREPMDRFTSGYSFFYAMNELDASRENVPMGVTHQGYEHYVDYALSTPNPHWMPQMELTGSIATHIHPFSCDSLRKWWPVYWPGRQPDWLNACTHLPTSDYRLDDLRRYYSADFDAYERAV